MLHARFVKKNILLIFILVSLLFHFALLVILVFFIPMQRTLPPQKQAVFVDLNRNLPQRIVDIPKPAKESVPDKVSAQSLYNQKVAEEKTAPSTPTRKTKPPSPKKEKTLQEKKPIAQKETPKQEFALEKQKPMRMPGLPEETPIQEAPSLPQEYLRDHKIGDKTYINTLANPNIRYFVELKRKFRETFDPRQAIRTNLSRIRGSRVDVVLGVSVNTKGDLSNLIIIRSSGIEAYDSESQRTVRSSAPFSSPPPEFISPDGQLHMAWTFIVYL